MSVKNKITRDDVKDFYSTAAAAPKQELCCPVTYTPEDISHIPEEVFTISYGCGSPVAITGIMEGEIVADLGSGGGGSGGGGGGQLNDKMKNNHQPFSGAMILILPITWLLFRRAIRKTFNVQALEISRP